MRLLVLEPFYGGSHRAFLDGWRSRSIHEWTLLTLPPHQWKWRMRQSGYVFAEEVRERSARGEEWDLIWASDMVPLTDFRALAPAEVARLPTVLYFHENQLTYPVRVEKERDLHFALTNLLSAHLADRLWFNSDFHRREWLEALPSWLRRMPDRSLEPILESLEAKSKVEHPGIKIPSSFPRSFDESPLRILWAARWEFDKNPELLGDIVCALEQHGVDFRLDILGESYREKPPVFTWLQKTMGHRIDQFGFVESRRDYERIVSQAHLFLSTAVHEFFGLSAVEAMGAGTVPLLPNRLSYPELVQGQSRFLYNGSVEDACQHLQAWDRDRSTLADLSAQAKALAQRFEWTDRVLGLDEALIDQFGRNSLG